MSVKSIIGKKVGMTQFFDEEGRVVPVTVLACGPCPITQIKTEETDGYTAVQLGFDDTRKVKRTPKAMLGHFARAGVRPQRMIREFRIDDASSYALGQEITVEVFEGVDLVKVTGMSKGRGFSGVMKRHGFGGGKETHGSHHQRRAGTIGMHQWPGHVFKNHPMPGRFGGEKVTTKNLKLVRVDKENNLLLVRGSVPGTRNGYVVVQVARG